MEHFTILGTDKSRQACNNVLLKVTRIDFYLSSLFSRERFKASTAWRKLSPICSGYEKIPIHIECGPSQCCRKHAIQYFQYRLVFRNATTKNALDNSQAYRCLSRKKKKTSTRFPMYRNPISARPNPIWQKDNSGAKLDSLKPTLIWSVGGGSGKRIH